MDSNNNKLSLKKKSATSLSSSETNSAMSSNKKQKKVESSSTKESNLPAAAEVRSSTSKTKANYSETNSIAKKQKKVSIDSSTRPSLTPRKSISDERLRAAQQLAQLSMSEERPPSGSSKTAENMPWGSLLFYESKKLVGVHDLSGSEPIKITAQFLMGLNCSATLSDSSDRNNSGNNNNSDYTDWQHVIGSGFTLRKKQSDGVFLQLLSEKSKLKVFHKQVTTDVLDTGELKIFDPEKSLAKKDLDSVRNVKQAYELTDSCYVSIVVIGQFMEMMGPVFLNSIDKMTKELTSSMPYWFLLKFNTEFQQIDDKLQTVLSMNNKK